MPALNSAVNGLRMHQQKIDTIADNIANVNTLGFKGSRAHFADSFYQTIRAASNRQPVGIAVGTGGSVQTISVLHTQGALTRTGGPTDVAITGEGFFMVRDPVKGTVAFTRAGDFTIDKNNKLINSLGMNVLGVVGDQFATNGDATDPGVAAPTDVGELIIPSTFVSQAQPVQATGTITVGGNLPDVGDTLVVGGVIFTFVAAGTVPAANSQQIEIGTDATSTASNIARDLAKTDEINALVDFEANTNVVSITGKSSGVGAGALGNSIGIGTGNAVGSYTFNANPAAADTFTVNGTTFTFVTTASAGTNILLGATVAETLANIVSHLNTTEGKALTDMTAFANQNGELVLTAIEGGTDGNNLTITSATAAMTASGATLAGGVTKMGDDEIAFPPGFNALLQNGADLGDIQTETVLNFSIGLDGEISLFGSAGTTRKIGYIMVAKFSNPAALAKMGNNLYHFTEAAGSFSGGSSFSITTDSRKPATDGIGSLQGGALELSNIDISEQFTEMILTQRGFEANARVITTSDEMLQTVVNLRR
jgi:flagellar hook protein FlgE